jgi:hypothetical protein
MKRVGIPMILAMVLQSLCIADITKLPTDQRKVLENSSRFRKVRSTTNLPPSIVTLCEDDTGKLAEPGQNWHATDLIGEAPLPRKRLIWAAVGGEYYVVHYERGGRGHSFHIMVATLAKGEQKSKVIWRGIGNQLKDYKAFLDALRSGNLDDRLDYAH